MKSRRFACRFRFRTVCTVCLVYGFSGCRSGGNSGCSAKITSSEDLSCPVPSESAPVHGLRADGRVDVTAAEAFPERPAEPAPSAADIAEACAAHAACVSESPQEAYLWMQNCLLGAVSLPESLIGISTAERAIPLAGAEESFPDFVRAVLAAGGDCGAIRKVLTARPAEIECQEDGCYWTGDELPVVTCEGDVATLRTGSSVVTRDCARASAHCSTASPTGCTDRGLVRCESPAKDRCDGDVKLGCDHCGLVSFHDCSWNGGHCKETPDGAECVAAGDASGCFGAPNDCTGTNLVACVSGNPVTVNCDDLGMRCETLPTGARPVDGGPGCGLAPCTAPVCVPAKSGDGGLPDGG